MVDFDSDSVDGEDEDETSADELVEDLDSDSDDGEDEDENTNDELLYRKSKIVSELHSMNTNPTFVSLVDILRKYGLQGHDPSLKFILR